MSPKNKKIESAIFVISLSQKNIFSQKSCFKLYAVTIYLISLHIIYLNTKVAILEAILSFLSKHTCSHHTLQKVNELLFRLKSCFITGCPLYLEENAEITAILVS